MKFAKMIELAGDQPVFESGLLLAGDVDAAGLRVQLSRWSRSGRVVALRRGLFAVAPPYRKTEPHTFLVANRLVPGSYVSRESVLSAEGLIPEEVPIVTSVAAARPGRRDTPLGSFDYRYLKPDSLFGYRLLGLGGAQEAFVAWPEKALLDLVHLASGGGDPDAIEALRLQHLERLDLGRLRALADRWGRPKLRRAAKLVARLAAQQRAEYETLDLAGG